MIDRKSLSFMPAHVLAMVLTQSTSMAALGLLPVIARKHFDANVWQTLIVTAAPTVLFSLSVFWNHLFNHLTYRKYALVYWGVAAVPLAIVGAAPSIWWFIAFHVISSAGGAGYYPAASEVLKHIYPPERRGRMYSVVWALSMIAGAGIAFGLGAWLEHSPEAFRWFLPGVALAQAVGMLTFVGMHQKTGGDTGRKILDGDLLRVSSIVQPVLHMREVLKTDRNFARYEAAYMTYGVGWMIVYALLPIFVTAKLNLGYEQIATSTMVAYHAGMVCLIFPAGMLMDRIGAARTTGLSFLLLALYPAGLIFVEGTRDLWVVSFVYGLVHTGASVGWMLGPVSFAPTPDKVPQYVAIHATFVGIRGKLFQLLGVGLYELTGSFTLAFIIAAAAYVWSAWQMFALWKRMRPR
ncbi:MAG: MFS transporter [Phycisphaerales bacterium]